MDDTQESILKGEGLVEIDSNKIIEWATRGQLVPFLVKVMSGRLETQELAAFFVWLRESVPQQEAESAGVNWKQMRIELAKAGSGKTFLRHLVLFCLTVADPLTSEYNTPGDSIVPPFPRTRRPLTAHLDVAPDRKFAIRVTRYMESQQRGLWVSQGTAPQGTFYFYEPDSLTFLTCQATRVLFAANKIHAAYLLLRNHFGGKNELLLDGLAQARKKVEEYQLGLSTATTSPALKQFVVRLLTRLSKGDFDGMDSHPMMKLVRWGDKVQLLEDIDHTFRRQAPSDDDFYGFTATTSDRLYVGYTIWSRLDLLDMPLRMAGKEAGFDVIMLQAEAGRFKAVTEVFDLRPRAESFAALFNVPLESPPDAVANANAPSVWYPRNLVAMLEWI